MSAQQTLQFEDGGSIPTSPHQYWVYKCPLRDIRWFVEKWHYSKSVNGLSARHCFKLMDNGKMVGACIFGKMAMRNQWKPYADSEDKVIELRRLCCIDDTPKNTESYFISKCIKMLKSEEYEVIVSYADLTYGHSGVIYKASNFKLVGRTTPGRVITYKGKLYHDHSIRTKYKGHLKPFAFNLKNALEDGTAQYTKTKGKNIYVYKLRKGEESSNGD